MSLQCFGYQLELSVRRRVLHRNRMRPIPRAWLDRSEVHNVAFAVWCGVSVACLAVCL